MKHHHIHRRVLTIQCISYIALQFYINNLQHIHYPPPSNSGKWRFSSGFPTKNVIILVVTGNPGWGVDLTHTRITFQSTTFLRDGELMEEGDGEILSITLPGIPSLDETFIEERPVWPIWPVWPKSRSSGVSTLNMPNIPISTPPNCRRKF